MEAEYFKQYAEKKKWIDHRAFGSKSSSYTTKHIEDIEERYKAWLCEALATGLENSDPVIVYKNVLLAKDYLKELESLFTIIDPEFRNGFEEIKKRIENILPESFK